MDLLDVGCKEFTHRKRKDVSCTYQSFWDFFNWLQLLLYSEITVYGLVGRRIIWNTNFKVVLRAKWIHNSRDISRQFWRLLHNSTSQVYREWVSNIGSRLYYVVKHFHSIAIYWMFFHRINCRSADHKIYHWITRSVCEQNYDKKYKCMINMWSKYGRFIVSLWGLAGVCWRTLVCKLTWSVGHCLTLWQRTAEPAWQGGWSKMLKGHMLEI